MNMTEYKPLQPLPFGSVLIVGAKASNFDDEIKNHPRVAIWDSQQQSWTDKDLPSNTRAIFMTRFIGHGAFHKIVNEARKRHITVFNPDGTGKIVKQVKELLNMHKLGDVPVKEMTVTTPTVEPTVPPARIGPEPKLPTLLQYVDWSKKNADNARVLLVKAAESGIQTTFMSLQQFVSRERIKRDGKIEVTSPKTVHTQKVKVKTPKEVDVSVQMLDGMIKELTDLRDFLVATVKENKDLKARVEKLRQTLG